MANKFYLTTPIYYVNAAPHIGHSYTTIAADTLSRYMRKEIGEKNVWFLTGTDEHGQKIQRAASGQGMTPQDFVDKTVVQFKELWDELGISYNDFIRTTEERHIKTVQRALQIMFERGEIYKDKYEGLYCTPCENFWLQSQVENNLCPDCKRPLEVISEDNYFLNLEKHQAWLIEYIKKNSDFILPLVRRNEVLSFLQMHKLTPLSISRPKERLSWGIPLPFSCDHVTYVWFDALVNYISAVGEFDEKGEYHSKWWPADLHLIGKDILRHHAIYWPIMLHALGIDQPKTIFAHGWWMIDENKMSKSIGNVVNPVEIVKKYTLDVYRYFILRDVPFGLDGNFSEEAIIKRFNGDLANDLGNLVYRTLTMIEKYYRGAVPDRSKLKLNDKGLSIEKSIKSMAAELKPLMSAFNFSLALERIWETIGLANKYVEETKPWNLAKENKDDELRLFIRLLVDVIRESAEQVYPFMPETADSIRKQLGKTEIEKGNPLFPRIETRHVD
jgi:methionyl-tRNA synthetase